MTGCLSGNVSKIAFAPCKVCLWHRFCCFASFPARPFGFLAASLSYKTGIDHIWLCLQRQCEAKYE